MANMKKIYLYTRFERFWHWSQAVIIGLLMLTGWEIHGTYTLFGFEKAAEIHDFCGIAWLVLFIFNLFWLATTGQWKHYVPTTKKVLQVARYYAYGIFKGETHPVQKSTDAKHNPLQRLVYLGLSAILLPIQMATGFLYYTYNSWDEWGIELSLGAVAFVHLACAFALLSFLIVHIYMTTTGHTITGHIAAMFSGWEEVDEDATIQDWEQAGKPG